VRKHTQEGFSFGKENPWQKKTKKEKPCDFKIRNELPADGAK